jgi:hypothetical protein
MKIYREDRAWAVVAVLCAVIMFSLLAVLIMTVNHPERYDMLRTLATELPYAFLILLAISACHLYSNWVKRNPGRK